MMYYSQVRQKIIKVMKSCQEVKNLSDRKRFIQYTIAKKYCNLLINKYIPKAIKSRTPIFEENPDIFELTHLVSESGIKY